MDNNANKIILTKSEYERLVEKVQELKGIVAALSAERDDLKLHICREIQADYDHKVGNLEYQIMMYNLEIERLRLIISFLQTAINTAGEASYEEAEQRADDELSEFYEELNQKAEDIKNDQEYAQRRAEQDKENERQAEARKETKNQGTEREDSVDTEGNDETNSDNDGDGKESEEESSDYTSREDEERDDRAGKKKESPDKELKRLYRYINKKLHPDSNPNQTEEEKQLFYDAQTAFQEGNLNRLREIVDIIDGSDVSEKYKNSAEGIAELKALLGRLIVQRDFLVSEISEIKNSFPYNAKDFLDDDEAVKKKQEELRSIINDLLATIEELNKRIDELDQELKEAEKMSRCG